MVSQTSIVHISLEDDRPNGERSDGPPPAEVFDHLPVPAWVFDARDRVVGWNRAAEQVYGLPAEYAIGQPAVRFIPHSAADLFARAAAATRRTGAWAGPLPTQTATEQPRPVEARWSLVGDPGDPGAVITALHLPPDRADTDETARAAAWTTTRALGTRHQGGTERG